MSAINYSELETMITDCWNSTKKCLTEWEYAFLGDMEEKVHKQSYLTEKQIEIINNIWERVT